MFENLELCKAWRILNSQLISLSRSNVGINKFKWCTNLKKFKYSIIMQESQFLKISLSKFVHQALDAVI